MRVNIQYILCKCTSCFENFTFSDSRNEEDCGNEEEKREEEAIISSKIKKNICL
jgi:hypothetical protein